MTKDECIRLVEAQLAKMKTIATDLEEPTSTTITINDSDTGAVHEVCDTETEDAVPDVSYVPEDIHLNNNSLSDGITFAFKVPEAPVNTTISTDRRRSVRIQQNAEKRKSIAPKLPSPTPPSKRRRTTISKKADRASIIGIRNSFYAHNEDFSIFLYSIF